MRRSGGFKRGRWFSICVAGLIGFLLGNWHAATSRPAPLSPAQNVALRFPGTQTDDALTQDAETVLAEADGASEAPAGRTTGSAVLGDTQFALLSPVPMAPPLSPAATHSTAATAETEASLPASYVSGAAEPVAVAPQPRAAVNHPAVPARHASRPGFQLSDAQIARIKARLHLRPDQEAMWPAVEAALRNIAYVKAHETRDARRHSASGPVVAAADNSDDAALQGLKSAATPLIMSFSDEQRNEVRSLAHVMGLDKLASEL